MRAIYERVAGLDVRKKVIVACIRVLLAKWSAAGKRRSAKTRPGNKSLRAA